LPDLPGNRTTEQVTGNITPPDGECGIFSINTQGGTMKNTKSLLIRKTLLSGLLALSVGSMPDIATAGGTSYGIGAPKNSNELPTGDFRKNIESLPSATHKAALQWLQSFEFTKHDLSHMRIDPQGAIFYADSFDSDGSNKTSSADSAASRSSAVTAKNVGKFHSRPGSENTIFVDFKGGVLSGTAWNNNEGVTSWKTRPYDTDGNPKSFSAAEVNAMAGIWHQIAEDYAPFDVDVTTEDPGKQGPKNAWILVTHSEARGSNPLPSPKSSSVAYMNIFGFGQTAFYSPVIVYYNNLGNPDAIAEASSHSIGHNLGLSHDGTSGSANAHGKGKVSWAPIMSIDHRYQVTQWSNGDRPGSVNKQNDIGVLVGTLGLRRDDHDDSRFEKGTPLVINSKGQIKVSTPETDPGNRHSENKGIIEQKDDVDVFVMNVGTGMVDITVTPAWHAFNQDPHRGANLDVHVALYNAAGKLVAEHDPGNETSSNLKTKVTAGRYKLQVKGVGNTASAYSGSGSLGQYYIAGTVPPAGKGNSTVASK
jgi:hypothetical protein